MLGLHLYEPLRVAELEPVLDHAALDRFVELGLVSVAGELMTLTTRGRMLGGAVCSELIVWDAEPLATRA